MGAESERLRHRTGERPGIKRRSAALRLLISLGAGYAWRSLRNGIKTVIGRKVYFNEEGLFFRQYFLHLSGLRPIRKITCPGLASEGAGSQALMIMGAVNFARCSGLTYLHTPFTKIAHAERPMAEWARAWEAFFNLGADELVCDVPRNKIVNYSRHFTELEQLFGWDCRPDELNRRFEAMLPEFKRRYRLNKTARQSDEITVAVHVRRGDALPENRWYYTGNETILGSIVEVKAILDRQGTKYRIRLYSEGNIADFAELRLPGIEFFLHADALWTLQELVEADVLILAKGFFSYYAALISDGIKIGGPEADDWWSRCRPDRWLACQPDGSFDGAAFERELRRLISSKAAPAAKTQK